MSSSTERPASSRPEQQQREALEDSERAASQDQPKTFRDEAIRDKIVEIGKIDKDDSAIKGLDPD